MKIHRRPGNPALRQQRMNLSPMMRLMIEKMAHRNASGLNILEAFVVRIANRPLEKSFIRALR